MRRQLFGGGSEYGNYAAQHSFLGSELAGMTGTRLLVNKPKGASGQKRSATNGDGNGLDSGTRP
jgi:hypothetical protein